MANITKDTFESGEINTLLAALFQFKESIQERYALGDSDLGEDIRKGYLHQCYKLLLAIADIGKSRDKSIIHNGFYEALHYTQTKHAEIIMSLENK